MDSQYIVLSELLSDQAAFITSPKTSLANYWGALPPAPPVSTGLSRSQAVEHSKKNLLRIFHPDGFDTEFVIENVLDCGYLKCHYHLFFYYVNRFKFLP